jgi:hypothetical protein
LTGVTEAAIAFFAAIVAGAINSVAGGGTLVTFPVLVWLGVPSTVSSATNSIALGPGSLASAWGYRRELTGSDPRLRWLLIPSLVGAIAGALLLRVTPTATFDRLVPFLILFATLLFMAQQKVQSLFPKMRSAVAAGAFQFFVGLYGGYFGAGIGILMLAALGILGLTDIHQMNGWKNLYATAINGVAALYFVFARMIDWPFALVMIVGAIAGGYGGAGLARKLGRTTVRRIVIAVGFGMALSLFFKK